MDALAVSALTALNSTITGLLPATVPGGLTREVRLLPEAIKPSGLGGYIGMHPQPAGEIYGRQLRAILQISIHGGNDNAASSYLDQVVQGLLTQHHGDLRREGIQSLKARPETADPRSARFDLSFEYRHLPTTGGDVIDTLDLGIDTNITPYDGRFLWDLASRSLIGSTDPLADFFAPSDLDLNASSPAPQWSFDDTGGRIQHTTAARGGPRSLNQPRKGGPQLLWRPAGTVFAVSRFIAGVEFESSSRDGIGLVFGRTDGNNLCFFLASSRHQYHVFGCREAGSYRFIGVPANDVGFDLDTHHRLTLTAYDRTLIATLDGVRTLAVTSDTPVPQGEVGFFTHGNNGARFHRARLIELI